MSSLTQRAEIFKLAALLELEPAALGYLERFDAGTIAALRRQISATLFDRHHAMFQRIAASSRLLPIGVLTVIAEKAVGPWLCAHIAGHMPSERAIEMTNRLPVGFLADVCIGIDPRRVPDLIRGIPVERALAVNRELVRRRDFITMGRFVGCMPDTILKAALNDIADDAVLLQVAFYAEDKDHLNHVISLLSEERIRRLIVAANDHGLWPEALALMTFVNEQLSRMLGDIAVNESDAVLAGMIRALHQHNLWPELLPILAHLSPPSRQRFVNLPVAQEPDILQGVISAASQGQLWGMLLPFLNLMDANGREHLSGVAAGLKQDVLDDIIRTGASLDLWLLMLDLVAEFKEGDQAELALAMAHQDDATLVSLMRAVDDHGRWQQLLGMAAGMSPTTRASLIERGISRQGDIVARLIVAAEQAEVWDNALAAVADDIETLVAIAEKLPVETQQRLLEYGVLLNPALLSGLLEAATRNGAWELALRTLAVSAPEVRARLTQVLRGFPEAQRSAIRQHARALGLESLLES